MRKAQRIEHIEAAINRLQDSIVDLREGEGNPQVKEILDYQRGCKDALQDVLALLKHDDAMFIRMIACRYQYPGENHKRGAKNLIGS